MKRVAVLIGACAVGMLSCAVGPDFTRPSPPPVASYTHRTQPEETISADGKAQRFEVGSQIASDWWRLFHCAKLDRIIAEAVSGNQDLQAAQAALRQSRELVRAEYGLLLPQVDGNFDVTRQRFSSARYGGNAGSSIFTLYSGAVTVSYALDIFGGARRAVEATKAQSDYYYYEAQATYLTLLGNVVNEAISQASYRQQLSATEEIIRFEQDQVGIAQAQATAGMIPLANVVSLQTQLAATEATLPALRQSLDKTDHLLATLAGRPPAQWASAGIDLSELELPVDLPLSLPSELVRRRPDILAAEAQLHAASANIGVATAQLFPTLTLSGQYGQNSTDISAFLKKVSSYWSYGASVSAPLFHGGTLWFQRKAAIENYHQSLANYRQTVLNAFSQVADVLTALGHDAETVKARFEALGLADQALKLTEANYQAGTVDYTQLLIANTQYQQARISYIQAQAQRLLDTVSLFVALGGGWWAPQ